MARVHNFMAGPSTLPVPALERARDEMLDYKGSGASVMEQSHRDKVYESVHGEAIALTKELLNVSDDYAILFFQGGATLQFSQIPMNLLKTQADYIVTGTWADGAYKAAQNYGQANLAATGKETNFNRIPKGAEINLTPNADYAHICSNNTIFGTQYKAFPDTGAVPLIADMSSDIMSRPLDVSKFGMIYAGAQKNIGPAGIVLVIMRKDLIERCAPPKFVPKTMQYKKALEENSMINTPATFSIYMVRNVLDWLKGEGGLKAIAERNETKAALIYDVIDASGGYYKGHSVKEDRSLMNITFNLKTPELEAAFISGATKAGLVGLKGHRSVGGVRASTYNAMTVQGCQALAQYMKDFMAKNG